jgi:hypothetical protein
MKSLCAQHNIITATIIVKKKESTISWITPLTQNELRSLHAEHLWVPRRVSFRERKRGKEEEEGAEQPGGQVGGVSSQLPVSC